MKRIEYQTVKYVPGLRKHLSGDDFGEDFLQLLNEKGQLG